MDEEQSDMKSIGKFRKRPSYGRLRDVNKKLKLTTHELGNDCLCKRLKCFQTITNDERQAVLNKFNKLDSTNTQNVYLSGLISCNNIKRRRPRKSEDTALLHDKSYSYHVKVKRDTSILEIPVCHKAFISIHGITKSKLEYLQKSIKATGCYPSDLRGKHSNRPIKKSEETLKSIDNHIKSFKGSKSHYSLKKTDRLYLSEDLNISIMYKLYGEAYPHQPVSYEFYRNRFNTKFNIAFGYPRKDTCSACDQYTASKKDLQLKLNTTQSPEISMNLQKSLQKIDTENMLHKKKAQIFYDRKSALKIRCQKDSETEAICMDFSKNFHVPNITTNDVYYKRQLSIYLFNIHVLASNEVIFYVYPETVANKGSCEVISMLHNFIENYLVLGIKHLEVFCDSCGGQNKNYNLIKYMHYIVHIRKKLDSIKLTFPIRGHSYLECDRDMAVVNQKFAAQLPHDWVQELEKSRFSPTPFHVEDLENNQDMVRDWELFFVQLDYKKKCPFPIRSIREIKSCIDHPRLILHRSSWNGAWEKTVILPPKEKRRNPVLNPHEFLYPDRKYEGLLPISTEKFQDLKHLKKFCSEGTQSYYDKLPYSDKKDKKSKQSSIKTKKTV